MGTLSWCKELLMYKFFFSKCFSVSKLARMISNRQFQSKYVSFHLLITLFFLSLFIWLFSFWSMSYYCYRFWVFAFLLLCLSFGQGSLSHRTQNSKARMSRGLINGKTTKTKVIWNFQNCLKIGTQILLFFIKWKLLFDLEIHVEFNKHKTAAPCANW